MNVPEATPTRLLLEEEGAGVARRDAWSRHNPELLNKTFQTSAISGTDDANPPPAVSGPHTPPGRRAFRFRRTNCRPLCAVILSSPGLGSGPSGRLGAYSTGGGHL